MGSNPPPDRTKNLGYIYGVRPKQLHAKAAPPKVASPRQTWPRIRRARLPYADPTITSAVVLSNCEPYLLSFCPGHPWPDTRRTLPARGRKSRPPRAFLVLFCAFSGACFFVAFLVPAGGIQSSLFSCFFVLLEACAFLLLLLFRPLGFRGWYPVCSSLVGS